MRTFQMINFGKVIGQGCIFDDGRVTVNRDDINAIGIYPDASDFLKIHRDVGTEIIYDQPVFPEEQLFRAMLLDEYQNDCMRTCPEDESYNETLNKGAMCIAGEAGELANMIKKYLWHGHAMSTEQVADELGDLMWYIATTAKKLGYDLSYVANKNIRKLKSRYPNGFSESDSINRKE